MKRVAFTLAFNCEHHLKRLLKKSLIDLFDTWVFVEGASGNTGSTSCCNVMPDKYHNNGHSIDNTLGFLTKMQKIYNNIHILSHQGMWNNKDDMVNSALMYLKQENVFLWEIDSDEIWSVDDIVQAEKDLGNADTGMFYSNFYVGKDLIAKGDWGEGVKLPYRRLWKWDGRMLLTHEPPVMVGGNGKEKLLPQRFDHYAYYYDKDVKFKNDWYVGHGGIYKRWKELQKRNDFPVNANELISGGWANGNTVVIKKEN